MIKKLDHTNTGVSAQIRAVFQASYAIEAEMLKAVDFPPLQRTLENFVNISTDFYGLYKEDQMVAVVEVKPEGHSTHIQSLVVAPNYFRQGLAKKMVQFVLDTYDSRIYTVETGVDNQPATQLYKNFGFVEIKQWDTDHGARKVRFRKEVNH